MKNHETLQEIYRVVGQLEGKIDVGFKNVTDRLDRINDNVAKNVKDIDKLQAENNKAKGIVFGIGIVGGIFGAIAGFIASFFKH